MKYLIVVVIFISIVVTETTLYSGNLSKKDLEGLERIGNPKVIAVVSDCKDIPYAEIAGNILSRYCKCAIKKNDKDRYDVRIDINMCKKTISHRSVNGLDGHGAVISGLIDVNDSNDIIAVTSFRGDISPSPKFKKEENAPFEEALRTKGSFVSTILELLAAMCGPEAVIEALKSNDILLYNVGDAVSVMSSIGSPVVPTLIKALNDDGSFNTIIEIRSFWPDGKETNEKKSVKIPFRYIAAVSLGEIKDRSAVGPLILTLDDKDDEFRKYAIKSLRQITQLNNGRDISQWKAWWNENRQTYEVNNMNSK
jgi:hypothetical protein